ncbi:uncharacterized protein LOC135085337 isoform X3 [Ostrinia nubilalis]|uniref:uncharacterized protein LOC135085337 isoform X3 n=1 Tax=Ostrinia nubilalis TaxID=29057 RepID=UPI0030825A59
MSGSDKKRSRKSKLIPRSENDDDIKLQDDRQEKRAELNKRMSPDRNQPSTSTYRPMQFDVKIEVEECDDEEFSGTITNFIPDDQIKTEITNENDLFEAEELKTEIINENDLFEAEELDINMLLSRALKMKKDKTTGNKDINNVLSIINDHKYTNEDEAPKTSRIQKPTSIYHLHLEEDYILEAIDELSKEDLSPADKILAVESKNLWGRLRMVDDTPSKQEARIQIALNSWKYWKVTCKGGYLPKMYKCYICEKAWWHLGPFQDHMNMHDDKELRVETESQGLEYNIIAYNPKAPHAFKSFETDTHCWKCGYTYNEHPTDETKNYPCTHCGLSFGTCIKLKRHECDCLPKLKILVKNGPIVVYSCKICDLKVLSKDSLERHYMDYHDVRSDLPTTVDVRTCTTCSKNYMALPFHYCNKKNYSVMCTFCNKRFPSKVALTIHLKEKDDYPCTVCKMVLRKKCQEAEHMLQHTDKFTRLFKCLSCKENVMLFNEDSTRRHKIIWHKQKIDKRRNYFEMVLAPRKFIEAQTVEELDASCGIKRNLVKMNDSDFQMSMKEDDPVTERLRNTATLASAVEVEIQALDSEIDIIDPDKPSTSALDEEEFEDINESIVKEKMLVEMQKNNSFTEDDEGYEYILSSVFNASGQKRNVNQVDDFEEMINRELKKTKKNETVSDTTSKDAQNNASPKKAKPKAPNIAKIVPKKDIIVPKKDIIVPKKDIIVPKKDIIVPKKEIKKPVPVPTLPILVNPGESLYHGRVRCNFTGCDHIAENRKEYREHKLTHKAKVMGCGLCKGSFNSIRAYLTHLSNHGYKEWTCPECLRSYTTYSSLVSHVKGMALRSFFKIQYVDKNPDPSGPTKLCVTYQCKRCKTTVLKENILDHWEFHIGSAQVNVEIEEQEGVVGLPQYEQGNGVVENKMDSDVLRRTIAALLSHKKKAAHNKTCVACGRSFDRRNDCKRHHIEHLLAHAYENKMIHKGLRCQICSKLFEKPDSYKQHMRDHGNLPIYQCGICFKTFSDSSNHVKHQKTHGSMYICDICKKKFQAKSSLIKHMECHSSTDPIKCIFCPKVFYAESDFSRHMRITHDQRLFKYSCIICKKKFMSCKDKWDHMWIEHKERRVVADCPVCGAEFRKVNDMKRHMKAHHELDITVGNMKVFQQLLHKMQEAVSKKKKNQTNVEFHDEIVIKTERLSDTETELNE